MKPPTKSRRGSLPGGGIPFQGLAELDSVSKREILQYDPALELHTWGGLVFVYRVKGCGGSSSDDILVHQFTMKPEQRFGLLNLLKRSDEWAKHGDGDLATKNMLKIYDEQDLYEEQRKKKMFEDAHHESRITCRDLIEKRKRHFPMRTS